MMPKSTHVTIHGSGDRSSLRVPKESLVLSKRLKSKTESLYLAGVVGDMIPVSREEYHALTTAIGK